MLSFSYQGTPPVSNNELMPFLANLKKILISVKDCEIVSFRLAGEPLVRAFLKGEDGVKVILNIGFHKEVRLPYLNKVKDRKIYLAPLSLADALDVGYFVEAIINHCVSCDEQSCHQMATDELLADDAEDKENS